MFFYPSPPLIWPGGGVVASLIAVSIQFFPQGQGQDPVLPQDQGQELDNRLLQVGIFLETQY